MEALSDFPLQAPVCADAHPTAFSVAFLRHCLFHYVVNCKVSHLLDPTQVARAFVTCKNGKTELNRRIVKKQMLAPTGSRWATVGEG